MIQYRTMAVFAVENRMRCLHYRVFVTVAILTVFPVESIFHLKRLPVVLAAVSMEAVHIAPLIDAEVLRHNKCPADQYDSDESHYDKKRPPYVAFH